MARPFQFSIRFLLVATTIVAAVIAAIRLKPSATSVLINEGLTILLATAAIVGAVQQTGKLQAFWIGVAVILGPAGAIAVYVASMNLSHIISGDGGWGSPPPHWAFWCLAPVNGVAAVLFHRLLAPRRNTLG